MRSLAETRAAPEAAALLDVRDLKVSLRGRVHHRSRVPVIDAATFAVGRGGAMGIVGESGSGKTMLCRTLVGTVARYGGAISGGSALFDGAELVGASERMWRGIRGSRIGYIPQSSQAGLNPVLTVRTILGESLRAGRTAGNRDARGNALELLELVHIPRARAVLSSRASELSGGMRQRVVIAAALAQRPELLIADEPTTALDVTVQRGVLDLLRSLRAQFGMALILITHDLAVIEDLCDDVMVMYAGATIEIGSVGDVSGRPRHPYTRALRDSRVDAVAADGVLQAIAGEPATVGAWPCGCRFAPRCPMARDSCRVGAPPPLARIGQQLSSCLFAAEMTGE